MNDDKDWKIILGQKEQSLLKENNTLVFGNTMPEFVMMPYAKYAKLVSEADQDKVSARLSVQELNRRTQNDTNHPWHKEPK